MRVAGLDRFRLHCWPDSWPGRRMARAAVCGCMALAAVGLSRAQSSAPAETPVIPSSTSPSNTQGNSPSNTQSNSPSKARGPAANPPQSVPSGERNPATPTFDDVARAAAAARLADQPRQAVRAYRQAVALRPAWEEGWWYLGTIQYDNNRYPQAIEAFQRLVQLDPGMGAAWSLLGLCEFETRDYADALAHLSQGQALGAGDDAETAHVAAYHLALLQARAGEFEQATETLRGAFGAQLPAQARTALGLALLRIPLLPEEIDPSQDALIQAAGEAAANAAAATDAGAGLEAMAALVRQYPRTPYLHFAYGRMLAAAGHPREALAQQQQEAALSPQSALPQIAISALELPEHPALALRAAQKAVALDPESAAAHLALAAALRAQGNRQQAAAQLVTAAGLPKTKPVREARIIRMYAASAGTAETAEAAPTVTGAAAEADAGTGRAVAGLDAVAQQAAALKAAGNTEAAMQMYRQALRTHPDWNAGLWSLTQLYYSTGHFAEAIPALKRWVVRQPEDGSAWAVLGLCEFETKDYANALIHLQRGQYLGFQGTPDAVQLATYRLGSLLLQQGHFQRATALLAPVSHSGALASSVQVALGMALLRRAMLPEQAQPADIPLLQRAGAISQLLQDSKYDQAFLQFQTLLKQYPEQPYLHYAYGIALASLARYDEAVTEMQRVAQLAPASELPQVWLASIALKEHRAADALAPAQHAVALAKGSAEAHYMLGRALLESGHADRAIPELETTERIMPDSPEVHFALAKAYARAAQPQKAQEQRAIFVRLNALATEQRNQHGSQAYTGPRDTGTLAAAPVQPNASSAATGAH